MRKYTTAGRVAALFCFTVALSSSAVASGGAAGAPTDGLRLHPIVCDECELDARTMDEIVVAVATKIHCAHRLEPVTPHITCLSQPWSS